MVPSLRLHMENLHTQDCIDRYVELIKYRHRYAPTFSRLVRLKGIHSDEPLRFPGEGHLLHPPHSTTSDPLPQQASSYIPQALPHHALLSYIPIRSSSISSPHPLQGPGPLLAAVSMAL